MSRPNDAHLVEMVEQGITASEMMARYGMAPDDAKALYARALALIEQRRLLAELRFIDESLRSWGWGPDEWSQLRAKREQVVERLREIEV